MRVFETAHDHCALPGLNLIARLDGRSFTRLTKEVCQFESPFDVRFRDLMVGTTAQLMTDCGFPCTYGYTESDEISLLLAPGTDVFGRKLRKWISLLAGEASARFTLALGQVAVFDCRISQLPTRAQVIDYFRWRQEDAHRNALSAHCYWTLRTQGQSAIQATAALQGLSVAEKNELLFQHGINFNDLPAWQKRGIGLFWETVDVSGFNPRTGATTTTQRRQLKRDFDVPLGEDYSAFLNSLCARAES